MAVSMKDVAKLADVSVMTVSRVVNQSAPVDDDTRKKVEEAIKKLHYAPNLLARRLRQQHPQAQQNTALMYAVYEHYREAARLNMPYPKSPGQGKKLGVAMVFKEQPFNREIEQNIRHQAELAGFDASNLLFLDNHYDPEIGLKNAEFILFSHPNLFIEYQADVKVNHIIAAKFQDAGIPILAVDIPVPGAPFVGVNNWQAATMGGAHLAKLITERWGGWNAVDLIALLQNPAGGDVTMLRSEGFAAALIDAFGSAAEEKIVRVDGGLGRLEEGKIAMKQVLADFPAAKRIAVTSVNEETMAGVIQAMQEAGRWNPADALIITLGVDDLGKSQIRDGLSNAGVAFFPEKYGEYLLPAACAIIEGAPVPSHIYVENHIITPDTIEQFYPQHAGAFYGNEHS